MKRNYSMTFNERKQAFVANVRKPNNDGWIKKWLPNTFTRTQTVEAEAWLISWINSYHQNWVPANNENVQVVKTLRLLLPKWLELRYQSVGTKMNTYKGFRTAVNCWLLDNPNFNHTRIEHLDIETELCKVSVLREWISSLRGAPRTRLHIISTLNSFLNDAIAEEWLSEDFINPFAGRALQKVVAELAALGQRTSEVDAVDIERCNAMLVSPKVANTRKVRYLVALHGLRDREIQGLVWNDLVLVDAIPYVKVERQLEKRGCKPFRSYEQELVRGKSKTEIWSGPNAVVSDPKKGSRRTIPLHQSAVEALVWWKKTGWRIVVGRQPQGDDPVFPRSRISLRAGQQAGDFCVMDSPEMLQLDLERTGLPNNTHTFHSLRRTFATQLDKAGVPDAYIDRLMGHGKKTVARRNYIVGDLGVLYEQIQKLPLARPDFSVAATIRTGEHESDTKKPGTQATKVA